MRTGTSLLALVLAGCGGGIHVHARSSTADEAPLVPRLEVRASLHPDEGRVEVSVRVDTVGPEPLTLSYDPRLTLRCVTPPAADGTPACSVDAHRSTVRVRGGVVDLVVEGRLDDDPELVRPYVGPDRVELTSAEPWFPRPEDTYELVLDVVTEGDVVLAATPTLDRVLGPESHWAIVGAPELVAASIDCASDVPDVLVAFDSAFPGPSVSRRLAQTVCEVLEVIVPHLGAPEGEGVMRLLVSPRGAGEAYYIAPRGLVVPAYFGGFVAPPHAAASADDYVPDDALAIDGMAPPESEHTSPWASTDRERLRRFAAAHETAHAFLPITAWADQPALAEGMAEYLAWSTLRELGEDVDWRLDDAYARIATDEPYAYEAYDRGLVVLARAEELEGRDVVDTFLRLIRLHEHLSFEEVWAIAAETIGAEPPLERWLESSSF